MSTTSTKRELIDAKADAEAFRRLFDGTYAQWHVAGSVRRRAAYVGDVEHVVVPRLGSVVVPGDLFGDRVEEVNLVLHRADELTRAGRSGPALAKHVYPDGRHRWGVRYRGLSFRGFAHELFVADPDGSNLGPTLAIRTGPAEYSRMLVTQLQRRGHVNMGGYVLDKSAMSCTCGWSGADAACEWRRGVMGSAIVKDPDGRDGGPFGAVCPACGTSSGLTMRRVAVPTELEYLALCGVPWAEPEDRR